jgi:hypothetical protein
MSERKESIDIGLALLSLAAEPGASFTPTEISAWCDCEPERIRQIEASALKKARRLLVNAIGKEEAASLAPMEEPDHLQNAPVNCPAE